MQSAECNNPLGLHCTAPTEKPVQKFIIIVSPEPGRWRAPVELRLRGLLKTALRAWGFRCLSCKPMETKTPENQKP